MIVGSFHAPALARLGELDPEIATSLPPEEVLHLWMGAHGLAEPWQVPPGRVAAQVPLRWEGTEVADREFVDEAHRLGLIVQVWTVDDPDEIEEMFRLGVDGVITDRPRMVRRLVDELASTGGGATDR